MVADVIDVERAGRAALVPLRIEHEVVDDELAPTFEQVEQLDCAGRSCERVRLFDLDQRQGPAPGCQLVAAPGEFFFAREQIAARDQPLRSRNETCVNHGLLRLSNSVRDHCTLFE